MKFQLVGIFLASWFAYVLAYGMTRAGIENIITTFPEFFVETAPLYLIIGIIGSMIPVVLVAVIWFKFGRMVGRQQNSNEILD